MNSKKDLTKKQWKELALESAGQLIRALNYLHSRHGGVIVNLETGERKHWRVRFADTLDKFPGVRVNRDHLFDPEMTKAERKKLAKG